MFLLAQYWSCDLNRAFSLVHWPTVKIVKSNALVNLLHHTGNIFGVPGMVTPSSPLHHTGNIVGVPGMVTLSIPPSPYRENFWCSRYGASPLCPGSLCDQVFYFTIPGTFLVFPVWWPCLAPLHHTGNILGVPGMVTLSSHPSPYREHFLCSRKGEVKNLITEWSGA